MGNLISAEGKGWHAIIAYRAIFANIRGRWGVRRWKIVGLARRTRSIGGWDIGGHRFKALREGQPSGGGKASERASEREREREREGIFV